MLSGSIIFCSLMACGVAVPNIKEAWDEDIPGVTAGPGQKARSPVPGAGQIEFEIKKQIYCDLRRAVQAVNKYSVKQDITSKDPALPPLPQDWGALVSISLEVDETAALSPGLALNNPMANAISTFGVMNTVTTPQSFSLGLGGTLSSTASRIDKFDPYYTIEELSTPIRDGSVCNPENPENDPLVRAGYTPAKSSLLIESDLGLTQWLLGAMFTNKAIPSVVALLPPTKQQLEKERMGLRKAGYSASEISSIIASGALYADVKDLEKDGYNRSEVSKYLRLGVTPISLHGYKKSGYQRTEIEKIVSIKAKESKPQSGNAGGGTSPPDTLSIEIKFVIVTNGNVTPTWKLVRVSANTGSTPFFGIGRTRTHDLIITIGPPNSATANTHLASQIGNAVSNSNRAISSASGSP